MGVGRVHAGCMGAAAAEADAIFEVVREDLRAEGPSRAAGPGLSRRRERPTRDAAAEWPMGASKASSTANDARSIRLRRREKDL